MTRKTPTLQPPSDKLTARVCAFCGKGKGTICFRQDGGPFYAHLRCLNNWRNTANELASAFKPKKRRTLEQKAEGLARLAAYKREVKP